MSGIAITFPSSPSEGQSHLAQNGFTYIYDSQKNRWKRGGEFVRAPKVLTVAGTAVTTTGAGIATGPTGSLIYVVPGTVNPSGEVGVDSFKAYRTTGSYPNYTEIQVSISSAFSSVAYAATFADTTHTIPSSALSGDTTYYLRARQFVGSNASAAGVGAISGYSANPVKFTTTSIFIDTPTIVSIANSTRFPVYQIGFAGTTLPSTVTYTGGGLANLEKVEWRVTGPRNPDSTGDTALAEVGIGTHSSVTLANALVLAMPFSGATGVGITNDVNNAIRTASGASAGTTKTVTANGGIGTASVGTATTTAHFYPSAAYFDGSNDVLTISTTTDFSMSSSSFTLEAWIYPTSTSGERGIFSFYDSNGNQRSYILGIKDSTIWWLRSDNGTSTTSSQVGSIYSNSWYHLALCKSGTITNIFLNGILVSSIGNDYSSLYSSSTTFDIGIGDRNTSGGVKFIGYIQDAKVYKGLAKYTESFTPPLPTYGTISYTTNTIGPVGVATTTFNQSTGDIPTAEVAIGSSTAAQVASSLVLAMPMNRTFGFQDINVAVRGLTSGASAGTAKTVGLSTTKLFISSTESKWYDDAAYFDGQSQEIYASVTPLTDFSFGTGDFTIELWVYMLSWNTTYDSRTILEFRPQATNGNYLAFSAGKDGSVYCNLDTTNNLPGAFTSGENMLNRWVHIAACRQSGSLTVFLNGRSLGSKSATTNSSAGQLAIGRNAFDPTLGMHGYLQDLKIYKGFAKYTSSFSPSQPICGFTTDLAIQTGFTTTTATGSLLSSVVGLGSTSTLSFSADQNLIGVTSITSSSGITTLPDPYAQNLVLALPLANITGVGNSFTNDRNTQIRSVSLVGGGSAKTITNSGVTTVSLGSTNLYYGNIAQFGSGRVLTASSSSDFNFGTGDFTVEYWLYRTSLGNNDAALNNFSQVSSGYFICLHAGTGFNDASLYLNGSMVVQGGTPQANVWNHYAYVRSSGNCRIYKNGILIASTTSSATAGATNVMNIGAYSDGTSAVTGYMQDVRIYNGLAKYATNFTPPPPMFGDYTRSTPNKIVFTPGSDYALEARNTSGVNTSNYSAIRQWGTKPKGGIYDPYASNLVLAIPFNNTTTVYDVTGQIKLETPTSSYSSGQTVTSPSSTTYTNKSVTNNGVTVTSGTSKFYGYKGVFAQSEGDYLSFTASADFNMGTGDFCFESWVWPNSTQGTNGRIVGQTANSSGNWDIYLEGSSGTSPINMMGGSYSLGVSFPSSNDWHHFAIIRKSGSVQAFINGIPSSTIINFTGNWGSSSDTFGISKIGNGTNYNFNGYFTDMKLYKGTSKYNIGVPFTPPNQFYVA